MKPIKGLYKHTKIFIIFLMTTSILVTLSGCAMLSGNSMGAAENGIIEITTEGIMNGTDSVSENINGENKYGTADKEVVDHNEPEEELMVCEIKGEVKHPGVYELKAGSRVNDLLTEAGGLKISGSLKYTNLARKLIDGEAVYIPTEGITEEEYQKLSAIGGNPEPLETNDKSTQDKSGDNKININTASASELETLPGVGPVTASNIISYREKNGNFKVIEDIKNVDRIGDKTFEKLKEHIKVK